ncbi:MAG: acetyl-CoA carboxylase carboxyl transferase subunit alpha, partial [Planctomycetaceae bacterium]|nr:acetyl-CoA carboxylase carboxyl transferase subunit alpha [Planctomycetaceae bacterium]
MATIDKINVPDFERPIVELELALEELRNTVHLARTDEEREAKEEQIADLSKQIDRMIDQTFSSLKPWQIVQLARHPSRPLFTDHVQNIADDWLELYGDRAYGDDPAIACGYASIDGRKVMIVGNRKGKTLAERVKCNFGCAHPEGYRKAMLKTQLAEKTGTPIITFINTPGAYPGVGAEERGQSMVIAESIRNMTG